MPVPGMDLPVLWDKWGAVPVSPMKREIGNMINVYTNKENYQYDVHALLRSFYPEHDVGVYNECEWDSREESGSYVIIRILDDRMELTLAVDEPKEYVHTYQNDTDVIKKQSKLSLYHDLCDYTGRTLPWGNLTGIRPTKLTMAMLAEGLADDEIIAQMKAAHAVSDEKARLSLDISRRERQILDSIHYVDGYSLYIGIPFCPTTCLYCSFTSYPIAAWRKRVELYLQALFREIDFVAESCRDRILDTIYIGGGTPTTLEAGELDRLLQHIHDRFDFAQVKEFTVEAGRADSITPEKLDVLKRHGVTRISVNPQTMNDETLKYIGRHHTVAQVKEAFRMARAAGFGNINMDIILGLPGELEADVQHTIDEIKKLGPDSLTVHSLAIKRASKLSQWIEENGIGTLRNTDATMEIAQKGAYALDMKPYYLYRQKNMSGNFENVGYAREGKYGIYNILINEEVQTIIALGAGSISKRVYPDGRIERSENMKDVALYIEKIDEMIERKRKLLEDE